MTSLNVLVGCEYSGVVREAFRKLGHNAYSCDLLPDENGETIWHFQDDIKNRVKWTYWDLCIFHPPCTHLAVSGARWFKDKQEEQQEALEFVRFLLDTDCKYIALENPVSIISSHIRKPDQYIQPWQFGHGETKKTGLWLKNLPPLIPTDIVEGREPKVHFMSPGPDRWKERSRTYQGIADAMASQWSKYIIDNRSL